MFKLIFATMLFVVVGCSKETSVTGLNKNTAILDSATVTIDLKNYNGFLPLVDESGLEDTAIDKIYHPHHSPKSMPPKGAGNPGYKP